MRKQLSPRQVAEVVGVSESSLKRWCDQGLLPVVRTAGGHRRLPVWGVLSFLRERGYTARRPEILGLPPTTGKATRSPREALDLLRTALVAGQATRFRSLAFGLYLRGHPLEVICKDAIAPAFASLNGSNHGSAQLAQDFLRELEAAVPPQQRNGAGALADLHNLLRAPAQG